MLRASSPPDRRAFGRRESFIHAMAWMPGRAPEPCIVRNYSDSGALIEFRVAVEPPSRFRLVVEAKGIDAFCEVRRRLDKSIGVSFVDDGAGLALANEAGPTLGSLPTEPQPTPAAPIQVRRPSTRIPGHEVRQMLFGTA
ncbi:MAG: hypothetical protein SFW09_19865 [Hyphomicrobiaceae bacterium]|nr:hypothetical protein [Hyphomicrobiaceae bacterium]